MANKIVNLTIRLKDGVSSGLGKINAGLKKVSGGFKSLAKVGLKAFAGLAAAVAPFALAIKKAFLFETLQTQIKVLVGSMSEAKKVFNDLKEFSASTPFELPGIIDAWQQLKTFTNGALNTRKGLELVGDAAAARGKDFSEMAYWTGRLYSALKNGDPFMDSVSAMQRMGVVGGDIRGVLTRMTSEGADFADMWAVVEGNLKKFEGGMKELSQTGGGLISTLKDNWTIAVATFGEAFMDSAKGGITEMINTIKRLTEDGTITKWANQAKDAFTLITDAVRIVTTQSGEARTNVLEKFAALITAGFVDGMTAAIKAFIAFIPTMGSAISDSIKGSFFSLSNKDAPTREQNAQAIDAAREETGKLFGPGLTSAYRENIEEIERLNKQTRLAAEGISLSDGLGSEISETKIALEQFKNAVRANSDTLVRGIDGIMVSQSELQNQYSEFLSGWEEKMVPVLPDATLPQVEMPSQPVQNIPVTSFPQATNSAADLSETNDLLAEQIRILDERLGGVEAR